MPRQGNNHRRCVAITGGAALALLLPGFLPVIAADKPAQREILVSADQVTASRLTEWKAQDYNGVVLELRGDSREATALEKRAARRIQEGGLRLSYWIEIGRNPRMAQEHPEWMGSLQGHREWRRFHKEFPEPGAGEVVKNYPWVPVLYKEAYQAHLQRVEKLLGEKPRADAVYLNDLQGTPSACGCGNPLCRWTADYGPIKTATPTPPVENDAPGRFVADVKSIADEAKVIPVWTTECEEHDGAEDGLCAGVGCFQGICWKAYTAQLMPVAKEAEQIGVLLPYKLFQRDVPFYGPQAGWITHALDSFQTMPRRHGGTVIPGARLIAVLQGWEVSEEELEAQIDRAGQAGVAGYVVSVMKLEQGWEPRMLRLNAR